MNTKNLTFHVLGRDNNEIGDNFESLVKETLARLGYGSFVRNIYKTGAEIDLRATHRVTGGPLLCECKAQNAPLGANAVRLFYSEWEKQRVMDDRLFGVIVSSAGFTGTAIQWYEELNNEKKRNFRLMDSRDLLSQLIESELTLDPGSILIALNRRFGVGEFHQCCLLYSAHGLSWLFEYSTDGRSEFWTIVDAGGEPLPNWKCHEIVGLLPKNLGKLELFGIDVRRKVQIALLQQEGDSIDVLTKAIEESKTDVSLALEILVDQGILTKSSSGANGYWFVRDIVPFVNTARDFLHSEEAVLFLKSKYAQEIIYSPSFISYIDNRYELGMEKEEGEITSKILCLSPSALRFAIFQDNQRYIQTRKDINDKIKDSGELERWLTIHRRSLLQDLVILAVQDLTGREYELSGHLSKLGIRRYRVRTGLDAVGEGWSKLSIHGEIMAAIGMAGEGLSAGNLIAYSDPVSALLWNAMFFLEVEEFERAEQEFKKVVDLCKTQTLSLKDHQAVLNNYALLYMRQSKWDKAAEILGDALLLGKPEHPEIISNKLLCHANQSDQQPGLDLLAAAPDLFPGIENELAFKRAKELLIGAEKLD